MAHSENDILISAYLDGELSAEERARAEQLLSANAEARQLLEELRALRAGLQELPQHRLEIDFAQRVLQKAEGELAHQQGLIDNTTAASIPEAAPLPETNQHSNQPAFQPASAGTRHRPSVIRRFPVNRRGVVWSLLAVAAAVLIMVSNRPPEQNRRKGGPIDEPMVVRAPAAPEQQVATAKQLPSLPELKPAENGSAQPGNEQFADDRMRNRAHNDDGGLVSRGLIAADKSATSQPAPADVPLADTNHDFYGFTAGRLSAKPPAAEVPTTGTSDNLLLVQVEMSPEAARQGKFDQLLAKNQIALEAQKHPLHFALGSTKAVEQSKNPSGDVRHMLQQRELSGAIDSVSAVNAPGANAALGTRKAELSGTLNPAGQQPVDLVMVEATPEQIQQTLADLRHEPQLFSAVAVTTVPSKIVKEDANGKWYSDRDALNKTEKDSAQNAISQYNSTALAGQQKTDSQSLSRAIRLDLPPPTEQPSFDVSKIAADSLSSDEKKSVDSEALDRGARSSAINVGGLGGGGFGTGGSFSGGSEAGSNGESGAGGERGHGARTAGTNTLSINQSLTAPVNTPNQVLVGELSKSAAPIEGLSNATAPAAGLPAVPPTGAAASAPPVALSVSSSLAIASPRPTPQRALFVFRIANAPAEQNPAPGAEPANPSAGK
ncbi:MAG TPA: hypothetical protein VMJ32_11170 [Pirellulales bacterium]|nr:hypothetical protein [Pirellulales bacterium]